jgi:indolepyruvate ferredoxin oxidoreductase alpha subunit
MGRNFTPQSIAQLKLGNREVMQADAGLLLLKGLLQSGVAYLGGYPGAPTSTLFDAIADSYEPVLKDIGVYFDNSGNEAAAAAMLQISVDHPIRGSVNWKVVGTNVAADALAHVSSSGVRGGVVIFVGEDYALDSTTVAEKTLPYAYKSGMLLVDPRADAQRLVDLVGETFALSETSEMPAFFLLRTRTGNLRGQIVCKDNVEPAISTRNRLDGLSHARLRVAQPPQSLQQERLKYEARIPAAQRYIVEHHLNDVWEVPGSKTGLITHGMIYNTLARSLNVLGAADLSGRTDVSVLCLNVVQPLVPGQILGFLEGKEHVLIVEEGAPPFLEDQIRALVQRAGVTATRLYGKDVFPQAGEYSPEVMLKGLSDFLGKVNAPAAEEIREHASAIRDHVQRAKSYLSQPVARRSPVFCTGCPERPIFSALKIAQAETGPVHYAGDIGCYSMGGFAPFWITDSVTGMGTGLASASAMSHLSNDRVISFMGDGTFWHSGLTTSFANSVYNNQDAVMVIFENGWTSMSGQQENPATGKNNRGEPVEKMNIEKALQATGVKSITRVNPYDLKGSLKVLRNAITTRDKGLKVVISDAECMLEKQRREKPKRAEELQRKQKVVDVKLGIDDNVCTGDHSCMRFNGCPSLTIKDNPNPLKEDDVATIVSSCVGCGLCGEVTQSAALCPSFFEVKVIRNPDLWTRLSVGINRLLARALFGIAA